MIQYIQVGVPGLQGPKGDSGTTEDRMGISVLDYGAVGDGVTDDTAAFLAALQEARTAGGLRVHVPAGQYVLSSTLKLPTKTSLVGAGKALTSLVAAPDTIFSSLRPFPSETNVQRNYRPLLTTDSVGDPNETVEGILVSGITFDWNNCPGVGHGTVPVWMANGRDLVVENIEIVNAIPGDYQDYPLARGAGILFTFTDESRAGFVTVNEAPYECVGVRYRNTDFTLHNSVINANNPWRHSIEVAPVVSGAGIPTNIKILHNTINVDGGTQDCVSIHAAQQVLVQGNTFNMLPGSTDEFITFVKAIPGPNAADDVRVDNNLFNFTERTTISDRPPSIVQISADNMQVTNNRIKGQFLETSGDWDDPGLLAQWPLIGTLANHQRNVTVIGNTFEFLVHPDAAFHLIQLRAGGFTVSQNTAVFRESHSVPVVNGPVFCTLTGTCYNGTVGLNAVGTGARQYLHGLVVESNTVAVVATGNNFDRADGVGILVTSTGRDILTGNNLGTTVLP